MIRVELPPSEAAKIEQMCRRWGDVETGGVLFGEHIAQNSFRVASLTRMPLSRGMIASFVRSLEHARKACSEFFRRTRSDFTRFNYLGEWHSHPRFELFPSQKDDETMWELVADPGVGANFAVLIIVKLTENKLATRAWAYFPDRQRQDVDLHQPV
jgi:hypothetical protein